MLIKSNLSIPYDRLAEFCRRRQIAEPALFGSVLHDDFRPDSDVDVLVTFSPAAHWSPFESIDMQDEIQGIFGREVDFVEHESIESGPNYIRRKHILQNIEIIYKNKVVYAWMNI